MNRLTKMIHYIFFIKSIFAKDLIEIIFREIIRFHDFFSSIVIDKNFNFIFKYNDTLCYVSKIKRKLSIVFHSQIDKQTKRQNNVIKHFFSNFRQF